MPPEEQDRCWEKVVSGLLEEAGPSHMAAKPWLYGPSEWMCCQHSPSEAAENQGEILGD